jgi:hypothetical protein
MRVPAAVDQAPIGSVPKDTQAMDHRRSEQTALIVGASRGIGLELAKEYLKEGAGALWRLCEVRDEPH